MKCDVSTLEESLTISVITNMNGLDSPVLHKCCYSRPVWNIADVAVCCISTLEDHSIGIVEVEDNGRRHFGTSQSEERWEYAVRAVPLSHYTQPRLY